MRMNNLLKVITRQLSVTADVLNLRPTNPQTEKLTAQPPRHFTVITCSPADI